MGLAKARELLTKGQELVAKYEADRASLDQLQQAQIVQSMIQAKVQLLRELQLSRPEGESDFEAERTAIREEMVDFEAKVQQMAAELDFNTVQESLERLSEGVGKIIEQAKSEQES